MPPGSVDADKVPEVLARIRKGERVQQHEALRMAKWGKPVSVSLTVSPIKDKQGAIIGAAKIVRDITEKKRAEDSVRESEERLRLALDAGQVGIWDWDILRSHITWSDTICRFFGLRSGEFSGRFEDFLAYLHPDDRERVGAAINHSLQSGDPYSIEMRVIWPDGTERWISTNGGVYFDAQGNAMRMNGASVDITERKGAEELLKTADRRKDEFLAMLAHELRNPLAPIRNAVQALNRISPPEPQQQRLREMIDRQVAHLARLVDDLLDVSRITRNKITLRKERLDLATAVRHAVETSRPLLDARKQHLTVNFPRDSARPLPPLLVEGDMVRLAQVISNLLNNSAKYTPEGGNISLTAERDGDEITIRVKDDGIGISPKVLPYVFDLFTQADRSPDRSQGGLGIGLTLVRLLVGMHGGGVEAHSEGQGLGSEFVVRLPAAQDAGPEDRTKAPPVAADNHSSRRFRILVVDDNVDAAETMAMLLEIGGHEVKTAHDGPAAVQAACDFRPHAVLLDIGLPGIDGYEVARRLRHLDETKETFLIAVTGYGKTEDRVKALTTGFNYHITKPVDPAELEIIIKNLKPTRAD
jgi:PAS domain S-box-containing protein